MGIHRPVVPAVIHLPDCADDLVARQGNIDVFQQVIQEIKLLGGGHDPPAVHCHRPLPVEDFHPAYLHITHVVGCCAFEQVFHSGHKDGRGEWLGDVLICPHPETGHLVLFGVPGGQHQDRHIGFFPDLPAGIEPVLAGHHHIEHHQDHILVVLKPVDRLLPVRRFDHLEPFPHQIAGNQLANFLLIFCKQNFTVHPKTTFPVLPFSSMGGFCVANVWKPLRFGYNLLTGLPV